MCSRDRSSLIHKAKKRRGFSVERHKPLGTALNTVNLLDTTELHPWKTMHLFPVLHNVLCLTIMLSFKKDNCNRKSLSGEARDLTFFPNLPYESDEQPTAHQCPNHPESPVRQQILGLYTVQQRLQMSVNQAAVTNQPRAACELHRWVTHHSGGQETDSKISGASSEDAFLGYTLATSYSYSSASVTSKGYLRAPLLWTSYLPLPQSITRGLGFQHTNFLRQLRHSVHGGCSLVILAIYPDLLFGAVSTLSIYLWQHYSMA